MFAILKQQQPPFTAKKRGLKTVECLRNHNGIGTPRDRI